MNEIKRMSAILEAKDGAEEGSIRCVFSTLGVVDRDNEIVLASAFTPGQPIAMVWSHDWQRPVGRGVIEVEPDRAIFDGKFFMDTTDGLNAFRTVKNMGELQEYSWGFRVLDSKFEERDGEPVRIITKTEIFEVSPTLIGAGLGTHTIGVKGLPEGTALTEEHGLVLLANQSHVDRLKLHLAWLAERKDGRVLSAATRARIQSHVDSASKLRSGLDEHIDDLTALLQETEPAKAAPVTHAGLAEAMRFQLIMAGH